MNLGTIVFLALGAIALLIAAVSCRAAGKADREIQKIIDNENENENPNR